MSSQNVCLICCYSFQEKRSRFISEETKDCFYKFCKELGFLLPLRDFDKISRTNNGNLDLPFGEYVTVCGDCLSLVVVYVQRRSVQIEKEENLLQLQKAVCQAIRELSSVVEDVQCHINRLHSTVRMGDVSTLGQFISRSHLHTKTEDKESKVKLFREKILTLSAGVGNGKATKKVEAIGGEPMLIKVEPADDTLDSFNDTDNTATLRDDVLQDSNLEGMYNSYVPSNSTSSNINDQVRRNSSTKRNLRRRAAAKQNYSENSWPNESLHELSDIADLQLNDHIRESDDDRSYDSMDEIELKPKRKYRRKVRPLRRERVLKRALKLGPLISPEQAEKWKEDLFNRIANQRDNAIHGKIPQKDASAKIEQGVLEQPTESVDGQVAGSGNNVFQVVDDQLKLYGVVVKVHERRRMLECMRCQKMYFEERDITSPNMHLETLMKNHILEKHCVVKKKRPVQEMEIIEYTSHTKSKITYKLADKNKYSYTRRCGKKDGDGETFYYRCDFRKGNCSAGIVRKNGKYIRLRKGWNENGFHSVHEPDVERTNRQIALGKAKYMYLTDDSKTIDEVCNIVLNQSGEEQPIPLSKLKRAMVYSKYGSRGLAPEEKVNQILQCCYCGKIYKEGRGLSRHMRAQHQDMKPEADSVQRNEDDEKAHTSSIGSNDLRSARRKSLMQKRCPVKTRLPRSSVKEDIINPPNSSCPSIVFNDPSAANNFVNRCINAIMQQVGVSVNANPSESNSASNTDTTTNPVAVVPGESANLKLCPPSSPTPSESSSQAESVSQLSSQHSISLQHQSLPSQRPAQATFGAQSNHWHQSQQPSGHQAHSAPYTPGGSSANSAWQWGLH